MVGLREMKMKYLFAWAAVAHISKNLTSLSCRPLPIGHQEDQN